MSGLIKPVKGSHVPLIVVVCGVISWCIVIYIMSNI